MRGFEPAFGAEDGIGVIRVHAQIPRVGSHIPGDETGCVEGGGIAVFDGRDVAGLDAQFALHVQKRFSKGGAFPSHDIPEPEFEIIETTRFGFSHILRWFWGFSPNHTRCPLPFLSDTRCLTRAFPMSRVAHVIEHTLAHDKVYSTDSVA